ncbi:site-specific DNA-methyltransferase [Pedobacter sp. BG31]|uniref:site-specific DNA-methyltransferase n=1 Tax=Pedobacter sp. BG31 TaxID=3349697 RepID=UPI0035F4B6F6
MAEQDFTKAGFTVVGTEASENKLLSFLKENYPNIVRDTEINIEELKAVLGLPIDEKVNGYGLNFVGRNFARAKYAQKTEKELRVNAILSKNFDTTGNLVLKGDNLDSLKILKNYYTGKIKCIYIDPPYNTTGDEFVYPDKFDKEEAEVLGLGNLSESDFARMDFSYKTKKSHNGWLSFIYPRLLLAKDLLNKEGVIFISIDDNEYANLKLLCDDVFGEEHLVGSFVWKNKYGAGAKTKGFIEVHEYILCYSKGKITNIEAKLTDEQIKVFDKKRDENYVNRGGYITQPLMTKSMDDRDNLKYSIVYEGDKIVPRKQWVWEETRLLKAIERNEVVFKKKKNGEYSVRNKVYLKDENGNLRKGKPITVLNGPFNQEGTEEVENLIGEGVFSFPKPTALLEYLLSFTINEEKKDNEIFLDFFAGSGTTGEAVMKLNANDGGTRKFILCQVDEAVKKDKSAYKFCLENNLPPVISSITIERIKRAGEKIKNVIEIENTKTGLFEYDKKQVPDIGFKIFDSIDAPKLKVDDKGQISITENENDALSRIYNMIFTVGLDEPTQIPEEIMKDCIYKIGNHYYITNSNKITSDDYSNAIKNGKVFIDGWTASLNGTLQNYKEEVKIVF